MEPRTKTSTSNVVEDLLAKLERAFPDPVDTFEDQLAQELGLRRHPGLSKRAWREARVRLINCAGLPEGYEPKSFA